MKAKTQTKQLAFLLMAFFIIKSSVVGQDFTIGVKDNNFYNSETGYPAPLQDYREASRAQYLYRVSDLLAAGVASGYISVVKFEVKSLGNVGIVENVKLKIGHTSANVLSSTSWESFNGSTEESPEGNFKPVLGFNVITLKHPFLWDGTQNILIEVCNGELTSAVEVTSTVNPVFFGTPTPFAASHTTVGDNMKGCGTTQVNQSDVVIQVPRTTFTWSAANNCTGKPVAGTANTSLNQVCADQSFALYLTGNTVAAQLTYQWQSSLDNSTWINMPGKEGLAISTSQAAPTYYRAILTCTNGSEKDTSEIAFVNSPALPSGNYTIDNSIPVSTATTFKTFKEAYNSLKCGIGGPVVFNVVNNPTPYNEQLSMLPIAGTSGVNTITFKGNGAKMRFKPTTDFDYVLELKGADYIIIDSLNIECVTGNYSRGIWLHYNADSNIIQNCTVKTDMISNGGLGMCISFTDELFGPIGNKDNLIQNNKLLGGLYGVSMVTSGLRNKIIGNTIQDALVHEVYLGNQPGVVVSGNDISRPNNGTYYASYYCGILIGGNMTGALIEKNRIHSYPKPGSNGNLGLYFIAAFGVNGSPAAPLIISNNAIYNYNLVKPAYSGEVNGIRIYNSNFLKLYHNTIVLDDTSAVAAAAVGIRQIEYASGIDIKNNIVFVKGKYNEREALYFDAKGDVTNESFICDYNILQVVPGPGQNRVGVFRNESFNSLADWKTAFGNSFDQHSLDFDPLFVDAANGDFTPSEQIINDVGVDVGITTDILERGRTVAPDPGAFEWHLSTCSGAPKPGIPYVSVSHICSTEPFTLWLNDYSMGDGMTYQWQASPDNLTWTDIGAPLNSPLVTTASSANTYYRCQSSCNNGTPVPSLGILVKYGKMSGLFTINKDVPNGGNNFNSFTEAAKALTCGIDGPVIFSVESGTGPYYETVTFNTVEGSSSTNTITINGNRNVLTNDYNGQAAILLNNTSYFVIDSLTIEARGSYTGRGIQLSSGASHNSIQHCKILAAISSSANPDAYFGVVISNSSQNLVEGNYFKGGDCSIWVEGKSPDWIGGNNIINNTAIDYSRYGILVVRTENAVISGNVLAGRNPAAAYFLSAVHLFECRGMLIEKNKVRNEKTMPRIGDSYALYIGNGEPGAKINRIENNIIYNMTDVLNVWGIVASGYAKVSHNTIVLDQPTNDGYATTRGIYGFSNQQQPGLEFNNNIIYINRDGNVNAKSCLWYNALGVQSNNNVLFNKPSGAIGLYNGINYFTLPLWQTANGGIWDQNSTDADPMFVNIATGNLLPQNPSIARAGNDKTGVTTDILGNPRDPLHPTPGAFEMPVVVPVRLLEFKGQKLKTGNRLEWATVNEWNNKGFELQRSANGIDFERLDFINSKAVNGNSNAAIQYNFMDARPLPANNWYRLKQVDNTGTVTYSNIVLLGNENGGQGFISNIYPNPARNTLYVSLSSSSSTNITLLVSDVTGKVLKRVSVPAFVGTSTMIISTQDLSAGTYLLTTVCAEGCDRNTVRFVKQ